ncbi:MAG: hypothetical protein R3B09_20215 [Nannocystaceae bacterium]
MEEIVDVIVLDLAARTRRSSHPPSIDSIMRDLAAREDGGASRD